MSSHYPSRSYQIELRGSTPRQSLRNRLEDTVEPERRDSTGLLPQGDRVNGREAADRRSREVPDKAGHQVLVHHLVVAWAFSGSADTVLRRVCEVLQG